MPLAIDISKQANTAWLAQITGDLKSPELKEIIGRAARNKIRAHLFALNSSRANRLGGKRTNFYAHAARSTHHRATSDGALVSINHVGIAQRRFGGTIRPRASKMLTIPAHPAAYGRRAREIPGLKLVPFKKAPALMKDDTVYYWLARSVTQQPDPSVLPTESELHTEAARAASNYTNRALQRAVKRLIK